jgi:pyruvate/2-oxoglutarate dehydrogenase complex dihydrolipoamide acyltransferase (E2) component
MMTEFVMPKLAMAMNEGTINAWLAQEGSWVDKGTAVAEVETEKVAYEVETPLEGFLHIVVPEGETVPVEVAIAQFFSSEEDYREAVGGSAAAAPSEATAPATSTVSTKVPAPVSSGGGRIKASPLARKMAAERNLDLAAIAGTGPGGRIVKRDILEAEQQRPAAASVAPAARAFVEAGGEEALRIPFTGMRAGIARRLQESLQTTAQLTMFWESEIDQLLALRQQFVAREEVLGTRVSVNALLIKAMVCAATRVPVANARVEGDEIVIPREIHVGIATALPGASDYESSLIVPVLRNAHTMGVVEIDRAMKSLVQRARAGELGADELSGSTITLSTTAGLAPPGTRSTPILNLPNTTLIGPSTAETKPVVRDGEVVVRTMLPISMTFDHRIMDGEPSTRFASALNDCIENPGLMLQ